MFLPARKTKLKVRCFFIQWDVKVYLHRLKNLTQLKAPKIFPVMLIQMETLLDSI